MALTAAERQKRRRDKLKNEGKYEDYKKKNRAEAKKSRDKKRNDQAKLPKSVQNKVKREIKENVRRRVRIKRQVWEGVKKRKQFVHATDFVKAATSSNMKIFEISKSDLQLRFKELNLSDF